jgi:hypothetical protein
MKVITHGVINVGRAANGIRLTPLNHQGQTGTVVTGIFVMNLNFKSIGSCLCSVKGNCKD